MKYFPSRLVLLKPDFTDSQLVLLMNSPNCATILIVGAVLIQFTSGTRQRDYDDLNSFLKEHLKRILISEYI